MLFTIFRLILCVQKSGSCTDSLVNNNWADKWIWFNRNIEIDPLILAQKYCLGSFDKQVVFQNIIKS